MSSYIAGIIDRSLQPLARIRPRIAMLFEPVRDRPTFSRGIDGRRGSLETPDELLAESDAVRPARPAVNQNQPDPSRAHGTIGQVFTDTPTKGGPVRTEPSQPTMSTRGKAGDVHRGTLSLPSGSVESPRPVDVGEHERSMTTGRKGTPEDQRRSVQESNPLKPSTHSTEHLSGAANRDPLRFARELWSKEESPRRQRTREMDRSAFGERSPEPETTVHVTIGRIEVRAEQMPDPARRAAAKPPAVMSLEEYLSRRTKRGQA